MTLTPDHYDSLAVQSGGRLESWMTNPPKPAMWHFTPEQRDAFAQAVATAARRDALEEAAKVCNEHAMVSTSDEGSLWSESCAAAIRKLKEDIQ